MAASPELTAAPARPAAPWAAAWPYLVLGLLTAAVFAPTLSFPLLEDWDDVQYVYSQVEKLHLTPSCIAWWFSRPYMNNYHPLTMLSLALDWTLWGDRVTGFRLQNLGWHLLAVAALFRVTLAFAVPRTAALLLVAAFAIHPQRLESVAWVAERKDVMCGALYLWSVWAYLTLPARASTARAALPGALFILALLAKPMAVSLPFVLALIEWHRGHGPAELLRRLWFYLLVAVGFMVIAVLAQGPAIAAPMDRLAPLGWSVTDAAWPVQALGYYVGQVLVVARNLGWYLGRMLVPVALSPLYPRVTINWQLLAYLVPAAAAIAGLAAWGWRRARAVLVYDIGPVLLAYPLALGPVAGLVSLGAIDYADRYSYLPHAAVLLALGLAWRRLAPSPGARVPNHLALALAVAYVAVLVGLNLHYQPVWQGKLPLMRHAAARPDANAEAIAAAAEQARREASRLPPGPAAEPQRLAYLNEVLTLARRLDHAQGGGLSAANIEAYHVIGQDLQAAALVKLRRFGEALPLLQAVKPYVGRMTEIDRRSVLSRLAEAHRGLGDYPRAIEFETELLAHFPNDYEALVNRGVALLLSGRPEQAARDFADAIEADPKLPLAYYNLYRALKLAQRPQGAATVLEQIRQHGFPPPPED